MKALQKLMAIGIGLIGFSFQANSYETDAYAKVVSSEPVWSVKTISQPISHNDIMLFARGPQTGILGLLGGPSEAAEGFSKSRLFQAAR